MWLTITTESYIQNYSLAIWVYCSFCCRGRTFLLWSQKSNTCTCTWINFNRAYIFSFFKNVLWVGIFMNFDITLQFTLLWIFCLFEIFCQLKIKSLKQRSNLSVTYIVIHHTNTTRASCPLMAWCKKKTYENFFATIFYTTIAQMIIVFK